MMDTTAPAAVPAPAAPAPAPQPAPPATGEALATFKGGHVITDPGDASPLGHPDGSDFVPTSQVMPALTVVLPGTKPL